MTTNKTEDKAGIKPEVIDLSKKIAESLKIDAKTGTATVEDKLYEKLLPANVTKEQAVAIVKHNSDFVAAATLAVGEASIPVMKKHADLDAVNLNIPMVLKDEINIRFDRSRQVPARDADNKVVGTKPQYGASSVEVVCYAAKTRAQLGHVKSFLKDQAMAAFGK